MNHNITVEGYAYRLRPVSIDDARFIIDVRLEDEIRNRFIHKISTDIKEQQQWLEAYFIREKDFYFVIESKLNSEPEGTIGLSNFENNIAEWGRWVVKKGAWAALEGLGLIFETAFTHFDLDEVYSLTVVNNKAAVSFHDKLGEKRAGIIEKCFFLEGKHCDAVKHVVTKEHYYSELKKVFDEKAKRIFHRKLRLI